MVEGLPAASFDTPETDNGRGEGTYLAGHPDAFEITTSGYTAANFRRDHLLSDEAAKLLESAKSGDSGRSSKELKEDASAKIEQIKSESIKERMQRIHKTGTAGKRYSAPAVVRKHLPRQLKIRQNLARRSCRQDRAATSDQDTVRRRNRQWVRRRRLGSKELKMRRVI